MHGTTNPKFIFLLPKNIFLATDLWRGKKIGVVLGERAVCILRTDSNQCSLSF
jgi:hypothetical protein